MAVRNSSVARGQLTTTGNTLVYTVPADFVLLLKNVIIASPGLVAINWAIIGVAQPAGFVVAFGSGLSVAAAPLYWTGWTAMNAGDQLYLRADQINTLYWVSGAVLPFSAAL